MKSKTHPKFQEPDGRITLNYICNKQNVDVAKYTISIMAPAITIVNLRIS